MGVIFDMYGDKRNAYRILVAKPQERPTLGDSGINDRILLKWIWVGNELGEVAVA
jgi:hypothetical protein